MKTSLLLSSLVASLLLTLCLTPSESTAALVEYFRDQMSSGAGWGINASSADTSAIFGYNYSANGIPEAPNSRGGDIATRGVKLEANIVAPASSEVFTLYPLGQSFSGNYQLRFDAWTNYDVDEQVNGGSNGTTEFIGGGIGYDGAMADIGVGAQFIVTNDGGSGSDYRAFANGDFLPPDEMIANDRNGFNAYYSDFLPGVSPPAGQSQVSFPPGAAGSPSFQWVTFEINTANDKSAVYLEKPNGDRLHITTINASGLRPFTSDGNIGIVYADFFTSVTPRPDLTFGIVDNVVVTEIPEPSTLLLALAAAGLAAVGRRQS